MLLVTAKLNNNNTEFHWVGGWWVRTHNRVKPTLLVKVELGFDKKYLLLPNCCGGFPTLSVADTPDSAR